MKRPDAFFAGVESKSIRFAEFDVERSAGETATKYLGYSRQTAVALTDMLTSLRVSG